MAAVLPGALASGEGMAESCDRTESGTLVLELSPIASVEGSVVPLAALLRPSSGECLPDDLRRTAVVRIDGKTELRVSREQVVQRLAEEVPGERLDVRGPNFVFVRAQHNVELPTSLVDAARQYLAASIAEEFETSELQVQYSGEPKIRLRYFESAHYDFHWRRNHRLLSKERVWVRIEAGDHRADEFPLVFDIEGRQRVYQLQTAAYRLNSLTRHLVRAEYVDVDELQGVPYNGDIDEIEMQFTRDVPAGEVLTQDMLRVRPAVNMGELVKVRVGSAHVTIEALAVSMHDANVGESVRLRSPSSNQFFKAQVVGKKQAVVAK